MRLLSILTFLVLLASMKVPALRRGNDDEEHVGPFSRPASMKVPALRRGNACAEENAGWRFEPQ